MPVEWRITDSRIATGLIPMFRATVRLGKGPLSGYVVVVITKIGNRGGELDCIMTLKPNQGETLHNAYLTVLDDTCNLMKEGPKK